MQLYADPISTTCLPVMMFLADHGIEHEFVYVNLMQGEHQRPEYAAINPNMCVPVLVDGDLVLTESSAILKYLADKAGATEAYPTDLKARARVNSVMDWFNTGLYRDLGYGVIYPQVLPNFKCENAQTQADLIAASDARARRWLGVLNDTLLADRSYVCGETATIADYLGSAYVAIADWVGYDLSAWPRVADWQARMRATDGWARTHEAWNGLVAYIKSQQQTEPA